VEPRGHPTDFFTGRLASCHFLQFGRGYVGARDEFVYGYFPSADDGKSYWENGDYLLLGRVHRDRILDRGMGVLHRRRFEGRPNLELG